MNVMVVTPFVLWTPHFETDLEIVQRHLDAGDRVILLTCGAELPVCHANPAHQFDACMTCIGRRKTGLGRLSGAFEELPLVNLTSADESECRNFTFDASTFDSVSKVRVDNLDLGWAALSSLVSLTRDADIDLAHPVIKKLLDNFMVTSLAIYRSVQNHLRSLSIDKVYIFNTRFATSRPVFRACQTESVPCIAHDRGCDFNHFSYFENVFPHDVAPYEAALREAWDLADPAVRESVAAKFFGDRVHAVKQSWFSFVENQRAGLLPDSWNESVRNIAIFSSSEDEFAAIGDEWRNPLYANQLECLRRLATDTCNLQGIRLFVRAHPNLSGVRNPSTVALRHLRAPNLEVILPESSVSTYAMMKHCDRVISFGSTTGIEATYWGKPSILAGKSLYRNLGATYNPQTHEDLMALIVAERLPPKEKVGALMYGYYEQTRGERFKYFEGLDVRDGLFKGERISPATPYDKLAMLASRGRRGLWANKGISAWSRHRIGL
jgi:hypothetical protein